MTVKPVDPRLHRRRFARAATRSGHPGVISAEVEGRLLDRLDIIDIKAVRVLNAASTTGQATSDLSKRYPHSIVVESRFIHPASADTKKRWRWQRRRPGVVADLCGAPFADGAFDLIFSHFALAWCDLDAALAEFRRLLRPEGVLLFTLFGPDTLVEFRRSFDDKAPHVGDGIDLHIVGDALVRAGFANPVMDAETLTVRYNTLDGLMDDLRTAGWTNVHPDRTRTLTPRSAMETMRNNYERLRENGTLPATFEIVYGHALGPAQGQPRRTPEGAEATISVEALKQQLRNKK